MGSVTNLTLKNVSITVPNFDTSIEPLCIGAVAGVSLGTLSNINVSGEIKGSGFEYAGIAIGGLVGQTQNKVEGCHANITINLSKFNVKPTNTSNYFGGLIGVTENSIMHSTANGSINISRTEDIANVNVSGLIGHIYGNAPLPITYCTTNVDITGNVVKYVGGFIATEDVMNELYFSYCGAKGNINCPDAKAGGKTDLLKRH